MKLALLTTDNREPFRQYDKIEPWFGTAPDALLQGFKALYDVEVHVISCTQRPMTSPPKLAHNIFFHSLHVPKIGWMRTAYQGCVRAVRRKLQGIRPDIVHGQGTERDCALCSVFSGFPNVLTIHGNMRRVAKFQRARPFSFYWLAARLEAFTIPRADGIVCITRYTQEAVSSLARRTWIVPNAVDASFFDLKPNPGLPPQILCVANVDGHKNQNAFILALDAIEPAGDFEINFFGKVDPQSDYGRIFLDLVARRPWCRFSGFVDHNQLLQHFVTAAGVVLPSLEDNCPMVILEAMAAGVPVAAAAIGGVPDLIRSGENGILFDPYDPAAMAGAVQELLSADSRRQSVATRDEARKRFHPTNIAALHLDIYRQVLGFDRGSSSSGSSLS